MSMPPPPGNNPPPYQPYQPPGQQPPVGYQQYGGTQPVAPQGTNGLSIASLVLSLVNIIPCFWIFPLPALLGLIFGIVGRGQISHNPGAKGKGMAIAGIVLGIVFLIVGAIFWVYVATSDNCYRDGSSFRCISN
jgi:Domain of unknown function (DUF4190)